MFVKLAGRACLVVGAGPIAESKVSSLLEAGARITVIAPEATSCIRRWAKGGKIEWLRREFLAADLEGMVLVVAATSSAEVHKRIYDEASRRKVLCNVVDVPPLCDFYYPSVVRRGDLQIAISTGGKSPALAQRLRKKLEEQFGPEYGPWLEELGREREKLHTGRMDPEERKELLHEQASEKELRFFRKKLARTKSRVPKRAQRRIDN